MMDAKPHDRESSELKRIRDIVDRHPRPDFIAGFDVRLGEFEGDPAMWIEFKLTEDIKGGMEESKGKLAALKDLRAAVFADLLDAFETRYPYFRFKVEDDGITAER